MPGETYREKFPNLTVFLSKNRVHKGRRGERQHRVYTMPQCISPKVAVVNLGANKFYSHVNHCHPFKFILCHLHPVKIVAEEHRGPTDPWMKSIACTSFGAKRVHALPQRSSVFCCSNCGRFHANGATKHCLMEVQLRTISK